MHDRADEDGMTGGQLFIRFGQATDEFVAEDDARLGTAMLASGNMEVAAAHSRVGDVDRYPAVARFGDRHGPDSDAGAALPHQSVLFNHRLCPHCSLASDSNGTVLDLKAPAAHEDGANDPADRLPHLRRAPANELRVVRMGASR